MKQPIKRRNNIYQIRIDIQGATPPIWRRLLIPADITFTDLHLIIQTAFQWDNCHLHYFETQNLRIGPKPKTDVYEGLPRKVTLDSAGLNINFFIEDEKELLYVYDFEDNWTHKIKLEAVLEPSPDIPFYPYCLKGKMRPPINDIGGICGYEKFVEKVTETPMSVEGTEMLEWYIGEEDADFDPAAFDRNLINHQFKP